MQNCVLIFSVNFFVVGSTNREIRAKNIYNDNSIYGEILNNPAALYRVKLMKSSKYTTYAYSITFS